MSVEQGYSFCAVTISELYLTTQSLVCPVLYAESHRKRTCYRSLTSFQHELVQRETRRLSPVLDFITQILKLYLANRL